jgi:hypothetical protein
MTKYSVYIIQSLFVGDFFYNENLSEIFYGSLMLV